MPKYLIIYHMHYDWPCSGPDDRTEMLTFKDVEQAHFFMQDLRGFPDCVEVHLYEYTGIQYVLVERWKKDV